MSKERKYNEDYVGIGCTFVTDSDGNERSQCFLCGNVLANVSLKPGKLKEHLTSVHHKNALDSVDYFRSEKARFEKSWDFAEVWIHQDAEAFPRSII